MRVSSSSESRSQKSEEGEKTEKKSKSKSTTTKKAEADETDKKAQGTSPAKAAEKTKKVAGAPTEEKKPPSIDARTNNGADSEVVLSAKGKEKSQADRELTQAETLMGHVNSGNLSEEERSNAMSRIGEIIRKYGTA